MWGLGGSIPWKSRSRNTTASEILWIGTTTLLSFSLEAKRRDVRDFALYNVENVPRLLLRVVITRLVVDGCSTDARRHIRWGAGGRPGGR